MSICKQSDSFSSKKESFWILRISMVLQQKREPFQFSVFRHSLREFCERDEDDEKIADEH